MAGRFFYVDIHFFHKNTFAVLADEFGPWGPMTWLALLAQGKNHRPAGQFTWTSESDAFGQLFGRGIDTSDIPFTFENFLKVTGRLKHTRVAKTSRTGRGHVANVELTRWGEWQKESRKWSERERKSRKRGETEADIVRTSNGHDADSVRTHPSSSSRTRTTPLPPSGKVKCDHCSYLAPNLNDLEGHLEDNHGIFPIDHPEGAAA